MVAEDARVSKTFSQKLLPVLATSALVIAVVGSLATAGYTGLQIKASAKQRANTITKAFARRAVFAALVAEDDPSIAERLVADIVEFDSIAFAKFLNVKNEVVASAESRREYDSVPNDSDQVVIQAVVSKDANDRVGKTVGYIEVGISQEQSNILWRKILVTNTIAMILVSLIATGWILRSIRQLTAPLVRASKTLQKEPGTMRIEAPSTAPQEFLVVSTAFNSLMDKLEAEREKLECKVRERTKELDAATKHAQRAEKHKSNFLANVTHEMRTPLHVIGLNIDSLMHELELIGDGGDRAREHVIQIQREAESLLSRIDEILRVAQSESGHDSVLIESVSIKKMLAELEVALAPIARANKNELVIRATGPDCAEIDRDKVLMICSNLLSNACKFTSNGKVEFLISVTPEELSISSQDTGIGIPKGMEATVFEAFRQGDEGEDRAYRGTGLGLAIVRNYAELMHGTIELSREARSGTHITVRIPMPIPVME